VNQTYDPNKWIDARDALEDAINEAHSNGHALYQFAGGNKMA